MNTDVEVLNNFSRCKIQILIILVVCSVDILREVANGMDEFVDFPAVHFNLQRLLQTLVRRDYESPRDSWIAFCVLHRHQ